MYVTLHSLCFEQHAAHHQEDQFIITASGIVTLCKQPYSTHTVRLLTEGDDTRGCGNKIGPPEDEERASRNMLRSVV